LKKTVAWVVSFATILGISISNALQFWHESTELRKSLLIVVLLGAGVMAVVDIVTWLRSRPRRYKDEHSINKYMMRLLKRGGSASIFAHNLTWVNESIQKFLVDHAKAGKVVKIYVPRHNVVTKQLQKSGVHIIPYSELDYIPEARFTVVNPNEPGSSLLAVGKGAVPSFYIDEYTDSSHSRVISIARDLFNILDRVAQLNESR
jgi:hypothetical protein